MTQLAGVAGQTESDRERRAFEVMITRLEGAAAELLSIETLNGDRAPTELKRIGYGLPLLLRYRVSGAAKQLVFRTQAPNWFGHDRRSDRACLSLLAADSFGEQPRHIVVREVGALRENELLSLRGTGEFYLVTDYVEGTLYANDLRRIERTGSSTPLDLARVEVLARHLAELHAAPTASDSPEAYTRSIRDLVGSGEGIFGIVDSYPRDFQRSHLLERIEELAVGWRRRIGRSKTDRLRRTHGDFHPYNILFGEGLEYTLLDASRGGRGDPADDLAALSINFLFDGIRCPQAWVEGFGPLWRAFFKCYLALVKDDRVLEHMAPFLAWRALVLACPAWYPDIENGLRESLLMAAIQWLENPPFDPDTVEATFTGLGVPLLPHT